MSSLPVIWACIIAFVIIMYVILDGFDLGIGILFPFIKDHHEGVTLYDFVIPGPATLRL
jgi:cytochrome d ubiquinol oxidase subunit II